MATRTQELAPGTSKIAARQNMFPGAMLGSAESPPDRRHRPDARKEQDRISYRSMNSDMNERNKFSSSFGSYAATQYKRGTSQLMQNLVRAFACLFCLGSSVAIAQEVAGAKAEPAELSIGNTAEIAVDFRTNQSANENPNPEWVCGLNVNFGDGKSEFHRVDNKQLPFKVMHKYDSPGNYAVTLDGKMQFRGFNTVLPCSGQSRSVAIIVRPENFAAREAAERAAQQEALNRAAADREAAQRAAEQAKADRASAERAAQKAAADRANAERQRATAPRATVEKKTTPKPQARTAPEKTDAAPKPAAPPPVKARSASDL